jgi:geranyl-CoA carboxylase alpha subunit
MLAGDGSYYFLEMNTRLQVEHPVTEAITGLDLVEWQIRIARGEPLPLAQGDVHARGHAIEVRLYAEAPAHGFLPQSGEVLAFVPPHVAGVRVDHGLKSRDRVTPHYDPMIAKLIATGATREDARMKLFAALQDTAVLGITTNRAFLIEVLGDPEFVAGAATTAFLGKRFAQWTEPTARTSRDLAILAALLLETSGERGEGSLAGWSSTGAAVAPFRMAIDERIIEAGARARAGGWCVEVEGAVHDVGVVVTPEGTARIDIDGQRLAVRFARDGARLHTAIGAMTLTALDVTRAPMHRNEAAAHNRLLAPMNGKVIRVLGQAGDRVAKGQCVVVLEAMKMQHEIVAGRAGTLASVMVAVGQQVATRSVLAELAD